MRVDATLATMSPKSWSDILQSEIRNTLRELQFAVRRKPSLTMLLPRIPSLVSPRRQVSHCRRENSFQMHAFLMYWISNAMAVREEGRTSWLL